MPPGASLSWITYEAEAGATNAQIIAPNITIGSFASESSGRQSVRLHALGHFVEVIAKQSANSVVVRYSIPDSSNSTTLGVYVNGNWRAMLNLTSRFGWDYGWAIPYAETPAGGVAHHFFDDARALVGAIPSGAAVRVQVDAPVPNAYYIVDLIDLELVSPPLPQPSNSLSILSFRAGKGGGNDDRAAIQSTIDEAKKRKMSVWIPPGRYNVGSDGQLTSHSGVAVYAAGMWHSTLHGNTRWSCEGGGCSWSDFAILGEATNRVQGRTHGFMGGAGANTTLTNVWVEHTVCGYWVGPTPTTGLRIRGCRFRNTHADAKTLCNGASDSIVEQSHFRNTGDDSIATWAPQSEGGVNTHNVFSHNTAQLPWRANCFAIYGGKGHVIEDSLCVDVPTYPGVRVGSEFSSWPFEGTTTVRNTALVRAGGWFWKRPWGALVVNAEQSDISGINVHNVSIESSSYAGVHLIGPHGINATTLGSARITGSGTWGVEVASDARGAATLHSVSIAASRTGAINNAAGSRFELRQMSVGHGHLVTNSETASAWSGAGTGDEYDEGGRRERLRKFDQLV